MIRTKAQWGRIARKIEAVGDTMEEGPDEVLYDISNAIDYYDLRELDDNDPFPIDDLGSHEQVIIMGVEAVMMEEGDYVGGTPA